MAPTPLAKNHLLSPSQKGRWPNFLEELSLKGLDYFLYDWEDEFLESLQLVGSSEDPKKYLDCQLLDLLVKRVGPDLNDLDYDYVDFAQELREFFEEFEDQEDEYLDDDDEELSQRR